ncbi:MAG: gliding motility lipoprotein GldD [Paludibacter sp.]|nr:gliding motility lipoprotein GldD [Paludibacter sp.]
MIISKYKYLLLTFSFFLFSCAPAPVPKPYGYFRIDVPQHAYHSLRDTLDLPYTFDLPVYATIGNSNIEMIEQKKLITSGEKWINIEFPKLNATIYCSYKSLHNNLYEISEEARQIVYRHSVRANAISEQRYENPDNHVFGILYNLKGNTASTTQFVLTDSVRNFFRAAVYFNNVPNSDSIAPMRDFINIDVRHIIETFRWKR